ncbi:MAG: hypothetical protein K6E30_01130 [Lachnospiraceae bacterium]|nr:hypothetical protein [Lachnospiraceae bacterium]
MEDTFFSSVWNEDGTINISQIPHLYFYPLINDSRAFFNEGAQEEQYARNNSSHLTVDEFRNLLTLLYDSGFVLVHLSDFLEISGTKDIIHIAIKKNVVFPENKRPLLLTEDYVNYDQGNGNMGFASKIVLDSGRLLCSYTNANGNRKIGEYDAVPILESFLQTHPDFSFNGSKMTLAMTGYNGVLGYRTDVSYKTRNGLSEEQKKWLDEQEDFDYETEVADAVKTANALKDNGYEFACMTWGDRIVGSSSLSDLKTDMEKWKTSAVPVLGEVTTLVMGHESGFLNGKGAYQIDAQKMDYYRSEGFSVFCASVYGENTGETLNRNYVCSMRFPLSPFSLSGQDEWASGLLEGLEIHKFLIKLDSRRSGTYSYIN